MAKVEVKCEWCGKKVLKWPYNFKESKHHFCSLDCSSKWRSGENHPKWKPKITLFCENCGKWISRLNWEVERADHHFCSSRCRYEWQKKNSLRGKDNPLWKRVKKVCVVCGETFYLPPAWLRKKGKRGQFCSRKCAGKWRSENIRGEKHPSWRGGKIKKVCETCGKEFTIFSAWLKRNRGRFCSKSCFLEWMKITMQGENNPAWKGGLAEYYGPNWDEQRRKALERDHHICQVCGALENEREHSVHHIVPFNEFGLERYQEANRLGNLMTLCHPCHMKVENSTPKVAPQLFEQVASFSPRSQALLTKPQQASTFLHSTKSPKD